MYITQVWLSGVWLACVWTGALRSCGFFSRCTPTAHAPKQKTKHTFCLHLVDHKFVAILFICCSPLRSWVVICCASLCHELARWYNRCVQQSTGPIFEASPDSPNYDIKIYKGIIYFSNNFIYQCKPPSLNFLCSFDIATTPCIDRVRMSAMPATPDRGTGGGDIRQLSPDKFVRLFANYFWIILRNGGFTNTELETRAPSATLFNHLAALPDAMLHSKQGSNVLLLQSDFKSIRISSLN